MGPLRRPLAEEVNPVSEDTRFPRGGGARVQGEDREFWKSRNADADSCGLGRSMNISLSPEEPSCVCVCMCVCMLISFVCLC